MNLKLKIVRVDMDGYNGRDHHPEPSDKGLVVTALSMASYHYEDDQPGDISVDGGMAAYPDRAVKEDLEYVWICVTDDGRTLELMGHEIEVV